MVVGLLTVELHVPGSQSLKEKRMVLRRIKDKVRNKFNVAIAEVGDQDAWQSARLGFAVVANERAFVERMVETIVAFIDGLAVAKLVDDEKDFVTYGEELTSGDDYSHWEPEE